MRKRHLKLMSLAIMLVLGSSSVWACTATPKANLSKPQTKLDKETKNHLVSEYASQTTTACEEKAPTKIQPAKQVTPSQDQQSESEQTEQKEQTAPTQEIKSDKKSDSTQQATPSTTDENSSAQISKTPKGKFVVDNFRIISQTLEKLGVTTEELDTLIKDGKNLPEVLEAKDISVKKFKKVLLKEYYATIKQGVKDEKLTKDEAKMLKYAIKQKICNWLQ